MYLPWVEFFGVDTTHLAVLQCLIRQLAHLIEEHVLACSLACLFLGTYSK